MEAGTCPRGLEEVEEGVVRRLHGSGRDVDEGAKLATQRTDRGGGGRSGTAGEAVVLAPVE